MQITGILTAYCTKADKINPEAWRQGDLAGLTFSDHPDMGSFGWTKIGLATITLDIPDDNALVSAAVKALQAEAANIRAKATAEVTAIEGMINQLLAIENKPSAPTPEERELENVAFDLGFSIKKAVDSDYYFWSADKWVEDSPATFDTPAAAARDVIKRFGSDDEADA